MTFCHTFYILLQYGVILFQFITNKGNKMSIIIKNAENMFERFETSIEKWAEKIF